MAKKYAEETKAAVMAALLTGQSIASVAAQYKLPVGTVGSWKARHAKTDPLAKSANEKRVRIGELVIVYLEQALETLRAQVKSFGDTEWLRTQSASEVAVLHGVIADKTIRLLEALAGDDEAAV